MNRMTGAEAMVRMLQLHGVKHIFGLCGDTSLPFYDALYRLDHGMQHSPKMCFTPCSCSMRTIASAPVIRFIADVSLGYTR